MEGSRINTIRRTMSGRRRGARRRGLIVLVVGSASTLLLAACGGPSATLTATQNLNAGVAAQKAGQYASAAQYYQKVVTAQPNDAIALYDLGDVEQLQGLNAAAKTHYLAALAINPNFVSALYNLATLDAKSTPLEAEALYRQVIKLSPSDADAHFNLGYVLVGLGHKSAGLAEINKGIKLDPSLAKRVVPTTTTVPPTG